jgi:hypothetical protein
MTVYADFSVAIAQGFPSGSRLLCCHDCECFWADNDACFLCGESGELLAIPVSSQGFEYLPVDRVSLLALSPHHVVVSDGLSKAMSETFKKTNLFANQILR